MYTEGPGIKLGSSGLVLHPGLAVELGYDSNVLLANRAAGAGLLRTRLHVDLSTLPPQRLDATSNPKLEFRFSGAFEYRQYFSGGDSNDPVGFARQLNGFVDANLAIKPRDPLSLRIYDNLIVTNDARNLEVASTETFIPRLYNRFGLLGVFRPGNGPLELGLGSAFRLDYYFGSDDPARSQVLERNRSIGNDANLYAQLRVLPQTSVKLEVRSSYVGYYAETSSIPQSVPLRITLGVNSLILPSLGVTAYAGYANSLHIGVNEPQTKLLSLDDTRYNSFIGGAELRVRLISKMRLGLGWARDFYDSIFATFLADDRIYLHYDHFLWRGLAAHVRLDNYIRNYGTLVKAESLGYSGYQNTRGEPVTSRSDILLNYNAELSYRALSWLEVGVNYSLIYDKTDFVFLCANATCPTPQVPGEFIKHAVMARIDFAY